MLHVGSLNLSLAYSFYILRCLIDKVGTLFQPAISGKMPGQWANITQNSIIKTTRSINICSDVYLEKHSLPEYACELSMPTLYTIQISHLNDLHRNCRISWGPNLISFFCLNLNYLCVNVSISSLNLNWDIKCNLIYPLKFIFNCWVIHNMYVRIQFLPASCQMQTLHWNSAHDTQHLQMSSTLYNVDCSR